MKNMGRYQMDQQRKSENNFSINQYKYIYEICFQKLYHTCNNNKKFIFSTSEVQNIPKKTNVRNKFHRGKNNKIKGKTFCYYCSGNSFKNYTLHTFFCEVDAQNKGKLVEKNKMLSVPTKKVWGNTGTSTKFQQTEKDNSKEKDKNTDDLTLENIRDENSKEYTSKYFQGEHSPNNETEYLIQMNAIDSKRNIPIVSAKGISSTGMNFENNINQVSIGLQHVPGDESTFQTTCFQNSAFISCTPGTSDLSTNSQQLKESLSEHNKSDSNDDQQSNIQYGKEDFSGMAFNRFNNEDSKKLDKTWKQTNKNIVSDKSFFSNLKQCKATDRNDK